MQSHLPYLNSNLEPPDIRQLAEALADETWLDALVVDVGMLQRVRVVAIHISRETESVTFRQHYKPDPEDPEVAALEIDIGCDDIIYIKDTKLQSVDEVPRTEPPTPEQQANGLEAMKDAAIQAVVDVTGGTTLALVRSLAAGGNQARQDMVDRRHLVLWAMFEMSDLKPDSLCWELGWKSPMPFQSARWKFTGKDANEKWAGTIKAVVKKAREIGGVEWRRPSDDRWRDECILP